MLHILFTNRTNRQAIISLYYIVLILMFLSVMTLDVSAVPLTPAAYWNFDDGTARDSSNRRLHGTFHGKPTSVKGVSGKALKFVGGQGIKIPDSRGINTGGPFPNRTVGALFYCDNAKRNQKQVVFEAGGITKGLAIYVYRGRVYVGAWNVPNLDWDGAYLFTSIKSKKWYYVVLVIRNATNKVQADKIEMWLDGELIGKARGAYLQNHGQDIGIAHISQHTKYHDGTGRGRDLDWFEGLIDEIVIYNRALNVANLTRLMNSLNVEPKEKFTTTWANLKGSILMD